MRYPCGSLHVDGTWFYGTYALDNENHQPGELGANRAGDMAHENCKQRMNFVDQGCFGDDLFKADHHGIFFRDHRKMLFEMFFCIVSF